MEKIQVVVKGTKRKVAFGCPECGEHNVKWIDKIPTTEADKVVGKIHVRCSFCEALLAFEPIVKEA